MNEEKNLKEVETYYAKGEIFIKIDNDFYSNGVKQDLTNFRIYKLD